MRQSSSLASLSINFLFGCSKCHKLVFESEGSRDFLFVEVNQINRNVSGTIPVVFRVNTKDKFLLANLKLGTFDGLLFILNVSNPLGEIMDFNNLYDSGFGFFIGLL